jgi:exopolysaccharide biosynthesis polyprenyl glycosylphosphotransferase
MSETTHPTSALPLRPLPRALREGRATDETVPAAAIAENADRGAVKARDHRYKVALAVGDAAAAVVALVLAAIITGVGLLTPATLALVPLVVAAAKLQGLYDRDELLLRKTTIDEAPQLFQLATLSAFVLGLLAGPLLAEPLSAIHMLVFWAVLFAGTVLARGVARAVAARLTPVERCLFIGDAIAFDRLWAKLEGSDVNAELVGRMNLQRIGRGARGAHDRELRELVAWTDAHRIIIDAQALPPAEMLDFVRAAKEAGVRVSLLPGVLDVVGTAVVFDGLPGMTVLGLRRFGLSRSSRLVKRAFDLAGAGLLVAALALPMALIALAIKLDTRGPVLFRQTRVGRDGQRFRICKFRTMVPEAEALKAELRALNEAQGGLFKIARDPRVTRVGRVLRKTSLDELPQLLNVLAGSMSLVGPRPLVVDEDEQITGWDRRRLQLTPGMTGHWQILGSARVPLNEMVKIDYLYVATWSLWADVKLLLRTVPYMLSRRGM